MRSVSICSCHLSWVANRTLKLPLSRWDQAAKFTSLSDCSDERDRQLKNVAQEAQRIGTEQEPSSGFSEGHQFSVVEQTVAASKCVSSEEPRLQATKLRPTKVIIRHCRTGMAKSREHTNRVSRSFPREAEHFSFRAGRFCGRIRGFGVGTALRNPSQSQTARMEGSTSNLG